MGKKKVSLVWRWEKRKREGGDAVGRRPEGIERQRRLLWERKRRRWRWRGRGEGLFNGEEKREKGNGDAAADMGSIGIVCAAFGWRGEDGEGRWREKDRRRCEDFDKDGYN
ncbi:hypothetical protein HAX54_038136 [Datura stramonium]|uniref:Uncharacterized protein n=1 Tax=Datura stramonium TaxID=4076 RepID=A0ABS8VMK9_DATST|nr:hypothetical protein [Datura stramonium]